MKPARPRLVFVSPLFLFPNDAGGKIRTTNILRGLKGGAFEVRLLSPATPDQCRKWAGEIEGVCDEFVSWVPPGPQPSALRILHLMHDLPVNVVCDISTPGAQAVKAQAEQADVDLFVFDFVHASVLRPARLPVPSVCFTHNVEAEIFARHAGNAKDPARRWIWRSQHAKMQRFEGQALRQYDKVIAVSERDAHHFGSAYGVQGVEVIPTGVDLDFFSWAAPVPHDAVRPPTVVFVGSMDYTPNIDAVDFFVRAAWPHVRAAVPDAVFRVVGRNPPESLQALARRSSGVHFTGFVPDVRPYVRSAHVSVIPLRVGGGTRIKAFEAMAMGCPVVSTSIGVEGLDVEPGVHYLQCDAADSIAEGLVLLLQDPSARGRMSRQARELVENRFGHWVAARAFESICRRAMAPDMVPS